MQWFPNGFLLSPSSFPFLLPPSSLLSPQDDIANSLITSAAAIGRQHTATK
jgi:hypothetical protein